MTIKPLQREGSASLIAAQLRDAIRDGSLAPGSPLRETRLATTLGVSRGPVREALQRLIQEGLVRSEPHRGAFVGALAVDDVEDLYRARSALEIAAATTLATRGRDAAALAPLERALERLAAAAERRRWSEVAELDLAFHEALVAASGSARLVRMFATVAVETRLCLLALEPSYERPRDLVHEHEEIVAAIRAGDRARIDRAVTAHMQDAVARLQKREASGGPRQPRRRRRAKAS